MHAKINSVMSWCAASVGIADADDRMGDLSLDTCSCVQICCREGRHGSWPDCARPGRAA